jgi:hypothetical protein
MRELNRIRKRQQLLERRAHRGDRHTSEKDPGADCEVDEQSSSSANTVLSNADDVCSCPFVVEPPRVHDEPMTLDRKRKAFDDSAVVRVASDENACKSELGGSGSEVEIGRSKIDVRTNFRRAVVSDDVSESETGVPEVTLHSFDGNNSTTVTSRSLFTIDRILGRL